MADRRRSVRAPDITQAKARKLRSELAADMTSAFKLMQADTEILIRKASREGWTVEELLLEIDKLLAS